MYNLVVVKHRHQYVVGVFDYKNNEIWNNTNYADLLVVDLKKEKFIFDNVLFDDSSFFCVELLVSNNVVNISLAKLVNICDFAKDDTHIANETMGAYGEARYLHRMFLKNNELVATN